MSQVLGRVGIGTKLTFGGGRATIYHTIRIAFDVSRLTHYVNIVGDALDERVLTQLASVVSHQV
jgi:hypothetical protein